MVTIEQKLSLFSKLLQQDIKNDSTNKVLEIEAEYEQKLKSHKACVEKTAKDIVEKACKKAQAKQLELMSKAKMQSKKEIMFAKEKYITLFIQRLSEKVSGYIKTPAYKTYLKGLLEECKEIVKEDTAFVLYLTQYDSDNYGTYLKELFETLGIGKENLSIEVIDNNMLGGFIIKGATKNIRLDLSIATLIDEHKDHIIECIFEGIGEVGEQVE